MTIIRRLELPEYENAATLSLQVYLQCGKDDFDEQGLESFKSFVNDKAVVNGLVIYGAFDEDNLVGVLATKNHGEHISLLYQGRISPERHRTETF